MACCISTQGATITWTNASGGSWGAAANWSPNQVPGITDTALITANGNYTVTLNANAQVAALALGGVSGTQNLTVSASTLTLTNGATVGVNGVLTLVSSTFTGLLTVSGALNWTNGGTVAGGSSVTILSNAVLDISGSFGLYLYGPLTNAGTVNLSGNTTLYLYQNTVQDWDGSIVNLPGALFNVQNDASIQTEQGAPFFDNEGTFLKSAGVNTTFAVTFTNSGVVDVASGTVTLNDGGVESGTLTGAGSVSLTGGTLTLNGLAPNMILAGATVDSVNASISNLTWTSGTLQGANTITGTASWTGGTIGSASSLTVASNAVLDISGSFGLYLYGPLTNSGTVNWSGTSTLYLYQNTIQGNDGSIVNLPGALFNVQNDESIQTEEGAPFFDNEGTFLKSAGNNTMINVTFTNSGVLDVASGTVTVNDGGAENGTVTGTGSVTVAGGTWIFNGTVQNLVIAGGTVDGVNASISNLTWSNGTLQGANTVTGTASWTGGTIAGASSLTVASNAVLNLSGTYAVFLYGPLTNAGTVNWSGTIGIDVYNYATYTGGIVNQAGALFNVENDETIQAEGGSPYFDNAGTFLKSAGNNTMIQLIFTNSGVMDVASGTVTLIGGGTESGTLTGAGSVSVTTGTLTLNGLAPNLILAGGTVDGVNASISNLTWSGGTLQGANTVTATASWTGGTIAGASSLTVASNAVLDISGTYAVFLYGPLTNAGTVNWSGTIGIDLYYYAAYTGSIVNQAGALFNVQNGETIQAEGGSPYFNNAGTFLKSAGSTTMIQPIFNNTGTVSLDIYSPSNFGQINFNGNVALAGVAAINFISPYSPSTGDSFPLLTYGSETGVFSSVNVPPPASWETNSITYGSTAFTLAIGSIYKLAFIAGPAGTNVAGAAFAPIVVQAQYLNGNPFATNGAPITIAMTSGSGILSGTATENTDATGKATFTNLSINLVGPKTLTASSPPWVTPTSNAVYIIPAAAAQLLLTTPITYLQRQGFPFSPAPKVQVLDQFGNIVSNSTILITAQSTSPGGGSLRGTTAINANGTNGVAAFPGLYYNLGNPDLAESATVYFTAPGVAATANSQIMVEFVSGLLTLTNGNSSVLIDPNSQNGMYEWKVDGVNQLSQHWYWLRQDPAKIQLSFDQLGQPLGLEWTSSNATLNYVSNGLTLSLEYVLEGGVKGSHMASVIESISVQNTTNTSLGLHLYDYTDFDLAGESDGDTVTFPATNIVMQQGKNMIATQMAEGQTPSYWEGSWYALALDTIEEATPAVLADSIIPNQAGDQTFAYQWDFSLPAGQMFALNLTNTIQSAQALLAIARSGTNVIISWPSNSAAVQNLQTGPLNVGATWTNLPVSPSFSNGYFEVTIPITNKEQFFRLEQ